MVNTYIVNDNIIQKNVLELDYETINPTANSQVIIKYKTSLEWSISLPSSQPFLQVISKSTFMSIQTWMIINPFWDLIIEHQGDSDVTSKFQRISGRFLNRKSFQENSLRFYLKRSKTMTRGLQLKSHSNYGFPKEK